MHPLPPTTARVCPTHSGRNAPACDVPLPRPGLKATEESIDTSTAAGKCFLDMLGVFAGFGTNVRRERQLEGIVKAKAEGVHKGPPASIDAAKVRAMKAQGLGATAIAASVGRAYTGCCKRPVSLRISGAVTAMDFCNSSTKAARRSLVARCDHADRQALC